MNAKKAYPFYFVIGALVMYILFFFLPGLIGIGYSFTDWSSYSKEIHFIGLENFKTVFAENEHYAKYLLNTVQFTVVTTFFKTCLGLFFGVLLTKRIKALNFHRAMMFMPSILSLLIIGIIFKSLLNPTQGFINLFLQNIGLESWTQKWLVDPKIAFYSVMGVDIWKGTGYIMTIIIAGLMSIPETYYEAANIDGANGIQKFFKITIPLLMPTLSVTLVLNIIYGLKVFDIVYVLTNGGPARMTEVLYTSVFKEISLGRYGVGTALSTIMFIVMSIIGIFLIRILTKNEVEE
jgi:raffinose/stachyose/melibiose transport system permease protein